VGSEQELNGTWDLIHQVVTSWWPSKSIPNKHQSENVASFFQNLAIPLPHPPQEKKQRICEKLFHFPLGITSLLSPRDLLGSFIFRICLQYRPKYLLWKHKLPLIIKPSKVPSNQNNVIHILYILKHKKREGSLWSLHTNLL
jgi:hypothetical protein